THVSDWRQFTTGLKVGLAYADAHRAGVEDPADWRRVRGKELEGFVLSRTILEVAGNLTSHRDIWAQLENVIEPFGCETSGGRAWDSIHAENAALASH